MESSADRKHIAVKELFRCAWREWSEDKASRLAASLAYYTMLSIAPLLFILALVAGLRRHGQRRAGVFEQLGAS